MLPLHAPSRPNPRSLATPALRALACIVALAGLLTTARAADVSNVRVPPGFRIEVLTDQVPTARQMALGAVTGNRATVYVGSNSAGKVYAVRLENNRAVGVDTVASDLRQPVGVAWRNGDLYVSAVSRILRLPGIDGRLANPPKPVVVNDRLPTESHHCWKFIAFGPDGLLYVPVGAPCNVCERDPERYANLNRMRPDGSRLEVFARGIRNTVGFDWNPADKTLWFTDNGRDLMGDDVPNDELNHAPRAGMHFGFPYCHQGNVPDPEFGKGRDCKTFTPPAALMGPHVAALGMRFYTGTMFPAEYRNNIFIAQHGSWNRSQKIGYRVMRAVLGADGKVAKVEPFAEGWLKDERISGRPVDVLVMPDGALLISDDYAGAIYRISTAQ